MNKQETIYSLKIGGLKMEAICKLCINKCDIKTEVFTILKFCPLNGKPIAYNCMR